MKARFVLPFGIGLILLTLPAFFARGEHYDLYVMSGQSNLNPFRYSTSGLMSDSLSPQDDVLLQLYAIHSGAQTTSWGSLRAIGDFSGPELTFGRDLAAGLPDSNIAIVKPWRSGTNLAEQWDPESTTWTYYSDMISFALASKAQLESEGHTVSFAGFAWVQGESDAVNESFANSYAANLTDFIAAVRDDLGVSDLPFVYSQVSPLIAKDGVDYVHVVRAQQALVAGTVDNVTMIDTSDLPIRVTDELHYIDSSKFELGSRLAAGFVPDLRV